MCKKETASLDQELIIPGSERVVTWEQFEEPHKSWNPREDYRRETKVILLEGVEEIAERAFSSFRDLCSIVIPASVKKIDATAFDECPKLREFLVDPGNPFFSAKDGALLNQDGTLLICCPSAAGEYSISAGVTEIGARALYERKELTSVILPDGVKKIGERAFQDCRRLEKAALPSSVKIIDCGAFYGTALTEVNIPVGVVRIGDGAFGDCRRLTQAVIPKTVEKIDGNLFIGCKTLREIVVDRENETFSAENGMLFDKVRRKLIGFPTAAGKCQIPYGVIEIGDRAFAGCEELEKIIIPEGVRKIEEYAFSTCFHIRKINLPKSVEEIGASAFSVCSELTHIEIPEGVTVIRRDTFAKCAHLTSVTIPKSVRKIEEEAFQDCKKLREIIVHPENPFLAAKDGALMDREGTLLICRPFASREYHIPAGIKKIGPKAFYGQNDIAAVTIPDGVTEIGEMAFEGCGALREIVIPSGVTQIGKDVFRGCGSLVRVFISETVKEMDENIFTYCDQLKEIVVAPENEAFSGENGALFSKNRKKLISYPTAAGEYQIPSDVTEIGGRAFESCFRLKEIILSEFVTSIDDEVFRCCDGLTIIAPVGSYAEGYAKRRGILFRGVEDGKTEKEEEDS